MLGCAILAAVAVGVHPDIATAVSHMVHVTRVIQPDADAHARCVRCSLSDQDCPTLDSANQTLGPTSLAGCHHDRSAVVSLLSASLNRQAHSTQQTLTDAFASGSRNALLSRSRSETMRVDCAATSRGQSGGIPDHTFAITHLYPWPLAPSTVSHRPSHSLHPCCCPPGTPSSSSRTKPCTRPLPRPTTPQPKPPPSPMPLPLSVPPLLLPPTPLCPHPAQPCLRMGCQVPSLQHKALSAAVTLTVAVAAVAANQTSLHSVRQTRKKTRMTTAQGRKGMGLLLNAVLLAIPSPIHMT